MPGLGSVLEAMVTAGDHRQQVAVELVSQYDRGYLTELVDAPLADCLAAVAGERIGHRELLDAAGFEWPLEEVVRAALVLGKPGQWRFERYDGAGRATIVAGCDGDWRWLLEHGRLRVWRPDRPITMRLPRSPSWQDVPHPPLREVLDPVLSLPAVAIDRTEPASSPFGRALRLVGRPRPGNNLFETSLVNPMADSCAIDVHAETGIILAVRNTRDVDWTLTTHQVTSLDLDTAKDDALFAVPHT